MLILLLSLHRGVVTYIIYYIYGVFDRNEILGVRERAIIKKTVTVIYQSV